MVHRLYRCRVLLLFVAHSMYQLNGHDFGWSSSSSSQLGTEIWIHSETSATENQQWTVRFKLYDRLTTILRDVRWISVISEECLGNGISLWKRKKIGTNFGTAFMFYFHTNNRSFPLNSNQVLLLLSLFVVDFTSWKCFHWTWTDLVCALCVDISNRIW